tara:strand:+ start:3409 stop:3873 length:465 start_codon:yes stop_codon:yes gene_type:complete
MSNFSDDMFVEGEDLTMVDSKRIAITIDVLKVLNDQAIENSYNQQLTEQFFVDVDRRFPAYLKMYMKHMHREGVPCEVHMRTIWECVLLDQTGAGDKVKTVNVKVDIPLTTFESLPNTPIAYALATDYDSMDLDEVTKEMLDEINSYLNKAEEE